METVVSSLAPHFAMPDDPLKPTLTAGCETSPTRGAGLGAGAGALSLQQKRLKQRQLAIKRKHDLAKNSLGTLAQNDLVVAHGSPERKAAGWSKFLLGVDGRPEDPAGKKPPNAEPEGAKLDTNEPAVSEVQGEVSGAIDLPPSDALEDKAKGGDPFSDLISVSGMSDAQPPAAGPPAAGPPAAGPLVAGPPAAGGTPTSAASREPVKGQKGWDLQLKSESPVEDVKDKQPRKSRLWPSFKSKSTPQIAPEHTGEEATCITLVDDLDDDARPGSQLAGRAAAGNPRVQMPHPTNTVQLGASQVDDIEQLPGAIFGDEQDQSVE
uniref:Uncharacterized protein n=1 Tax=Alexandrium andersonii TaxID=327968 RepID=A0A7S2AHA7_9DINO